MSLRDEMGVKEGLTYLNHASIGPLPKAAHEVIAEEWHKQMAVGEEKIHYDKIELLWQKLRKHGAKLMGGEPAGITITTNTASGLHVVADCLHQEFATGGNIVMPNVEFVTNSFVWQQVTRRYNLELRFVDYEANDIYEQWDRLIDDNTVLVALSHVQFSDGYKTDLKRIIEMAHEHGALVIVDAIQSLGSMPFEAKKWGVDFVAAAGYKWMLGPLGSGLLYMKPELAENKESVLVGWFSTAVYQDLKHHHFRPFKDARKFQQSMINPVLNAFDVSLQTVLRWGPHKTYNKVTELLEYLVAELPDDFSIMSSLDDKARSCIIKVDHRKARFVVNNLEIHNITVSYRDQGIRISPHAYNDKTDMDNLLDVLKRLNLS